MRVITLPKDRDETNSVFSLLYTATFAGDGAKDMIAARKLAKLQDAMDAISHEEGLTKDEAGNTGERTKRVLDSGVRKITLEDAHWETLKGWIFGAGIPWAAGVSRKIIELYDLVDGAEEITPGDEVES